MTEKETPSPEAIEIAEAIYEVCESRSGMDFRHTIDEPIFSEIMQEWAKVAQRVMTKHRESLMLAALGALRGPSIVKPAGNPSIGLWRNNPGMKEGKYPVILRRDGTQPEWSYFILGAMDPASEPALIAYAKSIMDKLGPNVPADDPRWIYAHGVMELSKDFSAERTRKEMEGQKRADPEKGPHRKDDPFTIAMARGKFTLAQVLDAGVALYQEESLYPSECDSDNEWVLDWIAAVVKGEAVPEDDGDEEDPGDDA